MHVMFHNTFQSGLLSVLYSIGSKPLQIWDKKVRYLTLLVPTVPGAYAGFFLGGGGHKPIFRPTKINRGE